MLNGMRNFAHALLDRAGSPATHKPGGSWLAGEEAIMGTAIRVELWSDDRGARRGGDRRRDGARCTASTAR